MKYCIHCGAEILDEAKFCGNCGKEVKQVSGKSTTKKPLIIGGCIGIVLVSIIVVSLFVTGLIGGKDAAIPTDAKLNSASSHIIPEKDKKGYADGIYTSQVQLGDTTVNLEVQIDENRIKSIQFLNLDESVTTMYPLVQPSLEYISRQLYEGQSLEDIVIDDKSKYTQAMLIGGIKSALEKAKTAD